MLSKGIVALQPTPLVCHSTTPFSKPSHLVARFRWCCMRVSRYGAGSVGLDSDSDSDSGNPQAPQGVKLRHPLKPHVAAAFKGAPRHIPVLSALPPSAHPFPPLARLRRSRPPFSPFLLSKCPCGVNRAHFLLLMALNGRRLR